MNINEKIKRSDRFYKICLSYMILWFLICVGFIIYSIESRNDFRRLDREGYLYYMNYTGDYYKPEIINALISSDENINHGCSAFFTRNLQGDPISAHNYDYPHRISKDDQTLTGLNIILHCKPSGKYESIAVADAIWCDPDNKFLRAKGPSKSGFDMKILDTLPYECMDGINEKGLFAAIMRVDIKSGDRPAKIPAGSSILLRYILDDCANVYEAINKAFSNKILSPEDWQNEHLFVSDSIGNHAVIESRNNIISVISSDIATNFYLAYDDIEDSYYKNGNLREKAKLFTDKTGKSIYKFGYGHGYNRFITIASQLERFRDNQTGVTQMSESAALVILQSVAQNPMTKPTGISMTQYSAIYNNRQKTLTVWPFQNYEKAYKFDVTGKKSK